MDGGSQLDNLPGDIASDEELLRATLRINTLVLGVVFGIVASLALVLVGILANFGDWHGPLVVTLIGVFLPGYGRTASGVFAGALWGFAIGASLGALVYRLNTVHVLRNIDALLMHGGRAEDFSGAVLRLHAPSLGLAIGAAGALGLIVTTNMLVLRGTADESVHASLLAEVLPGYSVTVAGSLIGAIELFVVLYLFCTAFVAIYNAVATWRRQRALARPAVQ